MLIVLSLNVIVFIAIAVALFWKYRLTRDAGFLWFSAAIVVWPLVSAGGVFGMDRLSSESVPFSLSPGEFVAGGVYILGLIERILFLVAIIYLYRGRVLDVREEDSSQPVLAMP